MKALVPVEMIEKKILLIRGHKVMLDSVSVNMKIMRILGGCCQVVHKMLAKVSRYRYNIDVKSICPPLNQLSHESARCPQRGFVFLGGEHAL